MALNGSIHSYIPGTCFLRGLVFIEDDTFRLVIRLPSNPHVKDCGAADVRDKLQRRFSSQLSNISMKSYDINRVCKSDP